MFTLTYADEDDQWVTESDISLEYALEQIKTMRPDRKWLMLQTYDFLMWMEEVQSAFCGSIPARKIDIM